MIITLKYYIIINKMYLYNYGDKIIFMNELEKNYIKNN